jgi:AcrR family transcriptional regulator
MMPKIVDHERMQIEIVEAAARVISRVGPQRATIRLIAAEAGYSPSAPLHYFGSRDALCEFAFQHLGERSMRELERIANDDSKTIGDRLAQLVKTIFERSAGDLFFARLLLGMVLVGGGNKTINAIDRKLHADTKSLFVTMLQRAIDERAIPVSIDPETEANLILTLADGLVATVMTLGEDAEIIAVSITAVVIQRLSLKVDAHS